MIPANELRIGNWAYFNPGFFLSIPMPRQLEVVSKEVAYSSDPIPLTPEILEKCGFNRTTKESRVLCLTIKYDDETYPCTLQQEVGTDHISICRSGIYSIAPTVKSLHQLQNLYFSLIGKELEVNL